jgi:hypothetical protein
VLHSIAVNCWIISASASVDNTYRCWSRLFSTGRTATISVMMPSSVPPTSTSKKPSTTGIPMWAMNSEPRTPPSIPSVPAVKENTREAENITL